MAINQSPDTDANAPESHEVVRADPISQASRFAKLSYARLLSGGARASIDPFDVAVNPLTTDDAEELLRNVVRYGVLSVPRVGENIATVRRRLHNRYQAILTQKTTGEESRQEGLRLSSRTLVGEAVLEAIAEEIDSFDIYTLAIPIIQTAIDNHPNPTVASGYLLQAGAVPPVPTQPVIDIIERLNVDNASTVDVALALAAALDSFVYNADTIDPGYSATLDPDETVDGRGHIKLTDVLEINDNEIHGNVARAYASVAKAVEEYESTPPTNLQFLPPTPVSTTPSGGGPTTTSVDAAQQQKYNKAYTYHMLARSAVQGLHDQLTALPAPSGTVSGQIANLNSLLSGNLQDPTAAGAATGRLISPGSLRTELQTALGSELNSQQEYENLVDRQETGLTGARACNVILQNYVERLGRTSPEVARDTVEQMQSIATFGEQEVQEELQASTGISEDPYFQEDIDRFNDGTRTLPKWWQRDRVRGRWYNPLSWRVGSRTRPSELMIRHLESNIIGTEGCENTLDQRRTSYYTLLELTNKGKSLSEDQKRDPENKTPWLPMTPDIQRRMENLERLVVLDSADIAARTALRQGKIASINKKVMKPIIRNIAQQVKTGSVPSRIASDVNTNVNDYWRIYTRRQDVDLKTTEKFAAGIGAVVGAATPLGPIGAVAGGAVAYAATYATRKAVTNIAVPASKFVGRKLWGGLKKFHNFMKQK